MTIEPPLLIPRCFGKNLDVISAEVIPGEGVTSYKVPPPIIYHYTSLETANLIINGQKLKFSSPSSFNDPFNMHLGLIDFNGSYAEKKIGLQIHISMSHEEDVEIFKSYQQNLIADS